MKIFSLLTAFSGRIGRGEWWLGLAIVIGLATSSLLFADPAVFDVEQPLPPPALGENLVMLVSFWISMAITYKRLQDRDWPGWVAPLVAVIYLPWYIGPFFGAFWDFESMVVGTAPRHEVVHMWLALAITVPLFVDNGFLRGTSGPNRYGPDPLAPSA